MTRTPHSHHSPEFKEQALLKARHRGTRSVISVAGELNMSAGTLRKWLQSASKKTGTIAHPVPAATAALAPGVLHPCRARFARGERRLSRVAASARAAPA
ncbi:hypothetical protein [Polaromonas sp. CG9_12]|nr:hypothetical protein [Polaromonas sp. CG9_12]